MKTEYKFNSPLDMCDLAREIQSKIYWGGTFTFEDIQIPWKSFWDVVAEGIDNKNAVSVIIMDEIVEFKYGEEVIV